MTRLKGPRALLLAGTTAALLASGWGMGVGSAQGHPLPHPAAPGASAPVTTAPTTTDPDEPRPVGTRRTIRYGPFTVPGAPADPDGTHGHARTGDMFRLGIEKPCSDCFVTGLAVDLVHADGTRADRRDDARLHRLVLFNSARGRSDASCSASVLGALGQGFFAAGDEGTRLISPPGHGYYTGWFDSWSLLYELANPSTTPRQVNISIDYWYVPASWGQAPGMTAAEPEGLGVDQCGDPAHAIAARDDRPAPVPDAMGTAPLHVAP